MIVIPLEYGSHVAICVCHIQSGIAVPANHICHALYLLIATGTADNTVVNSVVKRIGCRAMFNWYVIRRTANGMILLQHGCGNIEISIVQRGLITGRIIKGNVCKVPLAVDLYQIPGMVATISRTCYIIALNSRTHQQVLESVRIPGTYCFSLHDGSIGVLLLSHFIAVCNPVYQRIVEV